MPVKVKAAQQVIEGEVTSAQELEQQLVTIESELMATPKFQEFIELRNKLNDKYTEIRKNVGEVMIPAYIAGEVDKSLKGDWGSVTVTEKDDFVIDEAALAPKFFKKVPDTSKIRKTYQLENKAPKGAEHVKKYGIMLKFKKEEA